MNDEVAIPYWLRSSCCQSDMVWNIESVTHLHLPQNTPHHSISTKRHTWTGLSRTSENSGQTDKPLPPCATTENMSIGTELTWTIMSTIHLPSWSNPPNSTRTCSGLLQRVRGNLLYWLESRQRNFRNDVRIHLPKMVLRHANEPRNRVISYQNHPLVDVWPTNY